VCGGWRWRAERAQQEGNRLHSGLHSPDVRASMEATLAFLRQQIDAMQRLVRRTWDPRARTSRSCPCASEGTRVVRGELHFDCPTCGAPLCLVSAETGLHVTVGVETP
jgi:hypothetical protein